MDYILDFSAQPTPDPKHILNAGFKGTIRYIGFDPVDRPKCIGVTEYKRNQNAGLATALVFENHANDVAGGSLAGYNAAKSARNWANTIGFPLDKPIYFAVDSDQVTPQDFGKVFDYFVGITEWLPPRLVGVYGEYDVIEYVRQQGLAQWFWQTLAWSRDPNDRSKWRISIHNHLLQILGAVVIDGVECDRSEIHKENYGQDNFVEPTEGDGLMAWDEEDSANLKQLSHDMQTFVAPRKPDGSDDETHFRNSVVGLNGKLDKIITLLEAQKPTS